jgi:hypothetical protein
MRNTGRLTNAIRARKKAVAYIGAAAALVGAGSAGAASFVGASHPQPAAVSHSSAYRTVTPEQAAQKAVAQALSSARHAVTNAAHAAPVKSSVAAKSATPMKPATPKPAAAPAKSATPKPAAEAKSTAVPAKPATPLKPAAAPAKSATPKPAAKAKSTAVPTKSATPKPAAPAKSAAPAAAPAAPQPPSWSQIQATVAKQTNPSEPQAASQLQPVPSAGPQAWMPISPAQQANATTIVQQALDKHMGVRSAVIAVATAMQESQLQNLTYGDQDSLGLFQQRPSMGWGTAQQITTPSYAADAFLGALAQQQASNPGWAQQPLWATAQAVQKSGFPFAYAKWESQAVQMVKNIVTQVK